jgi:hypothetical protein
VAEAVLFDPVTTAAAIGVAWRGGHERMGAAVEKDEAEWEMLGELGYEGGGHQVVTD